MKAADTFGVAVELVLFAVCVLCGFFWVPWYIVGEEWPLAPIRLRPLPQRVGGEGRLRRQPPAGNERDPRGKFDGERERFLQYRWHFALPRFGH